MLWIGNDVSILIAAYLPAVIDDDILIPGVLHTGFHHAIRHSLNHVLADIAAKFVPRVPSHGRREREIARKRIWFLRKSRGQQQNSDNQGADNGFHFDWKILSR